MGYTPDTYSNSASTTVAGGAGGMGTALNPTDTTLYLPTGKGALFPSTATGPFMIRLGGVGLAKCTVRATDTLSLIRGQNLSAPDGPTASDPIWPVGTTVEQVVTAGNLTDFASAISSLNTTTAGFSAAQTKFTNSANGVYNIRDYGAVVDGVTDDGAAIRAALDACRAAGGGVVDLTAGTAYVNSTITHPVTGGGQAVALVVGSNTRLIGRGRGASTLKFGSLANQAWMIANYQTVSTYTDRNIHFDSFTLDGNAGGQNSGVVDAQVGIFLIGVANASLREIEVKHVFGTTAGANGPHGTAGEGMAVKLQGCDHVSHEKCYAWSDKTLSTSTAFSANKCNDVTYTDCVAEGWKNSMGFTHWTCWSVRHANCWSANNGVDGFHSEVTDGAEYTNCQSGGTTVAAQTALYASGANLGSGQMGFHLFQCARAQLSNCIAMRNTAAGLYIDSATGGGGSIQINGGAYNNNGTFGINIADSASVARVEVKGRPEISSNSSGEWNANGTAIGIRNVITSPAVPSSGVAFTNNYGIDMQVYITGGTVTAIAVDGVTVATSTSTIANSVRLRAGGTLTITYSVTPAWKWQAAG